MKRNPRICRDLALAALLALAAVPGAGGGVAWGLAPEEVAVIYNTRSKDSQRVARYYLAARRIPEKNLLAITTEPAEQIDERVYRREIVPQIRQGLTALRPTVKCLVTTYDVPLVIGPQAASREERDEAAGYHQKLAAVMQELEAAPSVYDKVGINADSAGGATNSPATNPAERGGGRMRRLQELVPLLYKAAAAAAAQADSLQGAARVAAFSELLKIQEHVWGVAGVLQTFQVRPEMPGAEQGAKAMDGFRARLKDLESQAETLSKPPGDALSRQKLADVRFKAHGLVGEAAQMDANIATLERLESSACFDNELMLVQNDQDYPRARWLQNPLNLETFSSTPRDTAMKVIMVTRLDGLNPDDVIKMIDTTLKVEKAGLDGRMYIDARGLSATDGYTAFDKGLVRAAEYLTLTSSMDVVLDTHEALLQAQDCPNAALYVGWYSLNSYHDSCQWLPGAVGYHVASLEMPRLHDANATAWAPNLLKRGFCGTLGAVEEPYLMAFPKPGLFFPLLLSGEFTQGEVYLVTTPLVSWRIGYVGDPLYNPFRAKPRLTPDKLKEHPQLRNAYTILRGFGDMPPPPLHPGN